MLIQIRQSEKKSEALVEEMNSQHETLRHSERQMKDNLAQLQTAQEEEKVRNWASNGLAKFSSILRTYDNLEGLYDNIIGNLVKYLEVNQGALYVLNDEDPRDSHLELVGCYAYGRKKFIEKRIEMGQGLVGQAVLEREHIYMTSIPEDYIHITSGLGEALPRALLLVPMMVNEEVLGVIELASFRPFAPYQIEFIQTLGETIAGTLQSVKMNEKTKILLKETREQAEQMRSQEEEMRQNMEELQATQEELQRKENEYLERIAELKKQVKELKKTNGA
ncbi:MAG: GAF domain-containing protein [Cytophagales bacterium]|nr:GAF domain-containing protein [Cytophagales bacterium]